MAPIESSYVLKQENQARRDSVSLQKIYKN